MSKLIAALGGQGAGTVAAASVAVVATVGAGVYVYQKAQPEAAPPQPVVQIETPAEAPPPEANIAALPAEPEVAKAAPQADPKPEPQVDATPPAPPSISTFRLDRDGQMLVAGRGQPGWDHSILVDGQVLASFLTEASGEFVQFLTLEASTQPRVLALAMRSPDGQAVRSDDEIIIAPQVAQVPDPEPTVEAEAIAVVEAEPPVEAKPEPVAEAEEVAEAEPEAEPEAVAVAKVEPEAEPEVVAEAEAPAPQTEVAALDPVPSEAPALPEAHPAARSGPAPEPQDTVTSQAVLISNAEGVRVVQPSVPVDVSPEVMSSVAIDSISYSATGEVLLAGRAAGDGFVRLYLDNAPVTTSRIEEGGAWRAELPEVDTQVYTLRVDEVDKDGNVTSRVETPFKREEPELVARQDTSGAAMQAITVQPGNTLWAISRDRYGEGLLYVRIFEANKDRIRDPDLIYPGQVFELPPTD